MNQNGHPDDFADRGATWEELTIVQVPTGQTSLTVRLTDDADNWVYSDAARIEQVYLPTLHTTVGGQSLESGQTLDMGQLLRGSPGEAEIEFTNAGLLPLMITNLVLPSGAGFSSTLPIDGELGLGASFTINIDLDTSPATGLLLGTHGFNISFNSNDVDEFQTTIPVRAQIVDRLIINDGDEVFQLGPGSNFGYLPSYRRARSTTTATYTITRRARRPT